METPPGVSLRPVDLSSASEMETAFDIVVGCERAAVGWTDSTRDSVRADLTGPDALVDAHRIAVVGGDAVGLLIVEVDRHGREVFLDAYAIGDDAAAVQEALMRSGLASAAELASADPAPGPPAGADPYALSPLMWQAVAAGYEQDAGYREALQGLAFHPIRRFWRMLLDLRGVSADEPTPPEGVSRRLVSGEADRRLMHALFAESFAEHFGSSHDGPFDDWMASIEALPGADPSQWWLAMLDDVPVGVCLLDDSKAEFGESYVRTLGVVPAARGRGVATWLLRCSAADAVRRGRTGLALSVDGQNTTGATALYQSLGFTTRQVIDVWCYPLLSASSR